MVDRGLCLGRNVGIARPGMHSVDGHHLSRISLVAVHRARHLFAFFADLFNDRVRTISALLLEHETRFERLYLGREDVVQSVLITRDSHSSSARILHAGADSLFIKHLIDIFLKS